MTRAIIYVPPTDYEQSADRCLDYVRERGYDFRGIVLDWKVVRQMLHDDEASVAIVASPNQLDPNRKPRVEFASHPPNSPRHAARDTGGQHWDERTRIIRRNNI